MFQVLYRCVFIYFLFIYFALQAQDKKAQEANFQFDENNRYIVYEVVSMPDTFTASRLYKSALIWSNTLVQDNADKIVFANELASTVELTVSFLVYNPGVITKPVHGKIHYRVTIECRSGKYRYIFSDFKFQYFKQDRQTLKYAPTNRYKPLEDANMAGFKKSWRKHKIDTYIRVRGQIENLKRFMNEENRINNFQDKPQFQKINIKDW